MNQYLCLTGGNGGKGELFQGEPPLIYFTEANEANEARRFQKAERYPLAENHFVTFVIFCKSLLFFTVFARLGLFLRQGPGEVEGGFQQFTAQRIILIGFRGRSDPALHWTALHYHRRDTGRG
jgi:hypothetical protein